MIKFAPQKAYSTKELTEIFSKFENELNSSGKYSGIFKFVHYNLQDVFDSELQLHYIDKGEHKVFGWRTGEITRLSINAFKKNILKTVFRHPL